MNQGFIGRRTFLLAPLALAAADRKPNLMLIAANRWRAQATPWAGDPDLVAPNLERLGKQSVVFSRAYACCACPSAALMTGRFPHAAQPDDSTIESILKAAGYNTAALAPDSALAFLEKSRSQPFFLRITWTGLKATRFYNAAHLHVRENIPSAAEPAARDELAVFYGQCSGVDDDIGRLLNKLNALGLAQDTIVVFTSDCGRQMGSQGVIGTDGGSDVPFDESVRIPLSIRYPRALPQGASSDVLVSQADLLPTLVSICGGEIPEDAQGRDLSSLIAAGKGDRPESVFAEGKLGKKDEWRMLVRGYDKIVANLKGDATHLYNLADDPYELTNVVATTSPRDLAFQLKRDGMLALMRVWMKKLGDRVDPSGLKKRN